MDALKHIRVIDLSQVMAGPYCSMLLADMGADVIKVEPVGIGESSRRWSPFVNGESTAFLALNRNKRGLSLDLKSEEGKEAFYRLIKTADVLVENYRPGVVKRLGVDYDTLSKINPKLVYCSISGFGQTGPYASRGGYDLIAQGMTGIMSVTGNKGERPVKCGLPITDLGTGLFACYGIQSALLARQHTGKGQYVDTSLFEVGLALSVWESNQYWYTGVIPEPTGSGFRFAAPYQAFIAKDGYFTVGADAHHFWPKFCEIIGLPEMATDERFADDEIRMDNLSTLIQLIEEQTIRQPRQHWLEQFEAVGIPAGPVNTYPEALSDPQALHREMVQEIEHPVAGKLKALGIPVKLSETPGKIVKAAPSVGEDMEEILTEIGYSTEEILSLKEKQVV